MRGVLLTSEKTTTFKQARTIIEHYEPRPLIEEYHKCLKTSCHLAERPSRTAKRLEAIIGLTSVLAVRLLHMKLVTRIDPDRSACEVMPPR